MDHTSTAIPRKLVETACRKFWLLAVPVVLIPALVVMFVHHPVVYESNATAWVADSSAALASSSFTRTVDSNDVPSERQAQVLTDLLSTQSFRQAVAVAAGLVP